MPAEISLANEPRELLEKALEWMLSGQRVAMLTLVGIEGSAPYPLGTQMLVDQEGGYSGQITGGCAELALADQAKAQILKGTDTVLRYGLNSQYFDIQLPCGSGIDVHFDVSLSQERVQEMLQTLRSRRAVSVEINCAGFYFKKNYLPNERLLIFGQGPIKVCLADLALRSGFDVFQIDHADKDGFADYCDAYTAAISLFHEHDLEIDIFAQALKHDLFYFGALGSRNTHAKRVEQLRQRGVSEEAINKIHGPIGLDIGAVSPAQIAISILAQLIAKMNQDGRFAS